MTANDRIAIPEIPDPPVLPPISITVGAVRVSTNGLTQFAGRKRIATDGEQPLQMGGKNSGKAVNDQSRLAAAT